MKSVQLCAVKFCAALSVGLLVGSAPPVVAQNITVGTTTLTPAQVPMGAALADITASIRHLSTVSSMSSHNSLRIFDHSSPDRGISTDAFGASAKESFDAGAQHITASVKKPELLFGNTDALPNREGAGLYVARVGTVLARHSWRPRAYHTYNFLLLDRSGTTSHALTGGVILVTTGLLRRLKSEDELAFVLARELAQFELGQPEFMMARGVSDDNISGTDGESFGQALMDDVDRVAARLMWDAGYDPLVGPELLRRLSYTNYTGASDARRRSVALSRYMLEAGYTRRNRNSDRVARYRAALTSLPVRDTVR